MTLSDGDRHIAGLVETTLETHMEAMFEESRKWLLRSLLDRGLATNDIFSFTQQQAFLTTNGTPPDKDTISAAMRAKIRDVNLNVRRCYRMKKRKERDLLRAVSDKSFILRRKLKKIRKKVNKERDKIRKKYIQKIDHLNVKQSSDIIEPKSTEREVTVTPSRLADYTNLSVFGTVADLPSPSAPRGPFVGSDKIKLCEEEKAILSKDPKFSVRGKSDKIKFLTEVE